MATVADACRGEGHSAWEARKNIFFLMATVGDECRGEGHSVPDLQLAKRPSRG